MPKIYQNYIDKKIDNNKSIYYSNDNREVKTYMDRNEVEDFLDQLFDNTKYVFNIPVMIKTQSKTYDTGIISRRGGILLTLDRDKIPISEVISIERKK